jgi:pre-mRNA-splicing factor SYF1
MKLCDICANHPTDVCNVFKVEEIIRSGIQRYTDEVGKLWCRLADYYIRLGQFERARDIFEEAVSTVKTVKDFSIIFDAYMKVEESIVTTKIRLLEEEEGIDVMNSTELSTDMELALARLEYLMEQRPLLLNSVKLRQNPNNIMEWHTRIKLYKGNANKVVLHSLTHLLTYLLTYLLTHSIDYPDVSGGLPPGRSSDGKW